ncbi:alkyl sulfatase dimerization domain-containing protein [Geodermatophilus sp. DF01_2]|uniref:alkyl sulfatase dimerization domain-containing protein n=1 Tax=Geodermatophilus sp. DF01-2 TaxID=2559610 RepID=UPI0024741EFD|nr:alkyl sulfatase dimerization domain-containing protein [Geodermatophilus sp. DF01_2]
MAQRSWARGQRVRSRRPDGGSIGDGTSPSSGDRRPGRPDARAHQRRRDARHGAPHGHGARVGPGPAVLRPLYDESEFAVRNVWRLYGGWYDGDPARLEPPTDRSLAAEVAGLAGAASALADRGKQVAETGDLRLACQPVERAAPSDGAVQELRSGIYRERHQGERSLMAKGVFSSAAAQPVPADR